MNLKTTVLAFLVSSSWCSSNAQFITAGGSATTRGSFSGPSAAGGGLTGGGDDCSAPELIAGSGNFAFDNSAATAGTDGQSETLCYDFGSSAIDNDIWFSWTSDVTGPVEMSTCDNTAVETRIAAYATGSCPAVGTSLACNDDA